jgi:hypothetical protein
MTLENIKNLVNEWFEIVLSTHDIAGLSMSCIYDDAEEWYLDYCSKNKIYPDSLTFKKVAHDRYWELYKEQYGCRDATILLGGFPNRLTELKNDLISHKDTFEKYANNPARVKRMAALVEKFDELISEFNELNYYIKWDDPSWAVTEANMLGDGDI